MTNAAKTKPADIGALAQDIQHQADTLRHLARTVSQAVTDIPDCQHCQVHRDAGVERIFLFTDLIEEIARKICAIAVQVEEADHALYHAASSAA